MSRAGTASRGEGRAALAWCLDVGGREGCADVEAGGGGGGGGPEVDCFEHAHPTSRRARISILGPRPRFLRAGLPGASVRLRAATTALATRFAALTQRMSTSATPPPLSGLSQ